MSNIAESRPPAMASAVEPAPMTLIRLMTGHWIAQAIFAIASLDVAGAIVGGAHTSDELASRCGATRRRCIG